MKRLCLIPLLFALPVGAQTINAASCSAADWQTAFNAVTNTTRTVNIPSCPSGVHWTTAVILNVPSGNVSLSVIGAGTASTGGGDQTVIIDDYGSGSSLLVINGNSSPTSFVRLSGITIQVGNGPTKYGGLIGVNGSEQFRFDHSHLNMIGASGTAGMRLVGCIYGVADRNIVDASGVNNGIQEYNQGSCNNDFLNVGDKVWNAPTAFGSANAFYLEYNVFNDGFANDCTLGGSFVMRVNTFNETTNTGSVVQTHPTGGAGRWRGCRQSETYLNTFNISTFMNAGIFISSGTGLIWGNSAAASSCGPGCGLGAKQFVQLESVLTKNVAYGQQVPPFGWGYCGTQSGLSGGGSNWDGSQGATGYPCLDQPGRGVGDFLTGGFTYDGSGTNNVTNSTTGCNSSQPCAYPRQALEPFYIWGSGWLSPGWQPPPSNTDAFVGVNTYGLTSVLNQNVDYYTGIKDDGTPITFTGQTGIGAGIRAARPATCTTGVAYWSTDQGNWNQSGSGGQGVLDLCVNNANGAWQNAWYTPYTLPHPLTGSQTSFTLTLTALNGTVTGPNCATGTYPSGTVIGPCTAVPIAAAVFTNWTSISGSAACNPSVNPCSAFTLSANSSLTPIFTLVKFGLTLSVANGTVSGPNCTSGLYPQGTTIGPCTATCTGSLTSWSAIGNPTCGGTSTNPCAAFSITINSALQANCTTGSQPHLSGFILTGATKDEKKNRHDHTGNRMFRSTRQVPESNAAIRAASGKRSDCPTDHGSSGELLRCGGDHGGSNWSAYDR